MNNSDHKSLALQALERMKPTVIDRARFGRPYGGWVDMTPKQRQAVTAQQDRLEARIQAAMEWVRRQED